MSKRPGSSTDASRREDRLRAALRANLARRKAQGRARAAADDEMPDPAENRAEGGDSTVEPRQE